jgi:hypothetical protein
MTPTAALVVSMLVAAGTTPAAAQGRAGDGPADRLSTPDPGLRLLVDRTAARALATPQVRQPPEPPPPPPRPVRLGSMVGYNDNPVVASMFRVRFDTAFEDTVPDRAEYFYAKCGCYRGPGAGADQDPDAPGPGPGAANDVDFQQLYLSAEYAFSPRLSVFGELPFRWLRPQDFIEETGDPFPDQSGLSDIRAGAKLGLIAADDRRLTAQVRFFFPSGDAGKGLGTDHATIEPSLIASHRVNDVVLVESQAGLWLPLGGSAPVPIQADGRFAGNILFYGIGPSFTVYASDRVRFAPVVELVGWHVFDGFQTGTPDNDAGGTDVVNLKVGARTAFERGSVYVGYGFALTDRTWYDNVLRLEYRVDF